jgi:hypothetical protein
MAEDIINVDAGLEETFLAARYVLFCFGNLR